MVERAFQVVEDDTDEKSVEGHPARSAAAQSAAVSMLGMALKALSQRALIALSSLFTLLTVGSVFWLAMSLPDPNTFQLAELGMYALFVLLANWIVKR